MILTLALAALLQAPAVPASAPARAAVPTQAAAERPITSLADTAEPGDDPHSLGALPMTILPGQPFGVTVIAPVSIGWQLGGRPDVLDVVLTGLGTGYQEQFYLQLPLKQGGGPVPLLMLFHKYGSKANDGFLNTSFPYECARRGWFYLSSLGATKKSFSCLPGQTNREAVWDWVMAFTGGAIDPERQYGVGFSMGGGSVVNWAARHQDPSGPMLAAAVDHTGGVALEDTWLNDAPVRTFLEFWAGGTPATAPFGYQRSSAVSFDPITLAPDASVSMGVNLVHMPLYVVHASADPLGYLVQQTKVFKDFMLSLGGVLLYEEVPFVGHEWSSLDERAACDFLSGTKRSLPLSGTTLADEAGRWVWCDLEQDAGGAFTRLAWALDPLANRIDLAASENLKRISVDAVGAGLDLAAPLEVSVEAADGLAETVALPGFSASPGVVLRDGLPSLAWSWDAVTGVLELLESDPGAHLWRIEP